MKTSNRFLIVVLLLLVLQTAQGQWKSFIISPRGDTLNRIDQQGLKQGPWVNQVPELRGEQGYEEQGYYLDDKKDGLWKKFSLLGDKIAEENYRWDALDGKARYYNRTGGLIRQESWRAVDPEKTMDTVDVVDIKDPSKVLQRVVVKLEGRTMKHGPWAYYNAEWGDVERVEHYFMDKLRTDDETAQLDDDLKPIDVTGKKDDPTKKKPQAILDYEKKNSGKKKVRTRDGSTGN